MRILTALLVFLFVLPTAVADRVTVKPKATIASVTAKRDKLVKVADDLRALVAKPPTEKLSAAHQKAYDDFVKTARDTADGARALATKLTEGLKAKSPNLDSMSELADSESLRLQIAMDRQSKMMSTLSNLLKKISDTSNSITQNMK